MFRRDRFIEDCHLAISEGQKAVRELVLQAVADPAGIISELGEPNQAGVFPRRDKVVAVTLSKHFVLILVIPTSSDRNRSPVEDVSRCKNYCTKNAKWRLPDEALTVANRHAYSSCRPRPCTNDSQ